MKQWSWNGSLQVIIAEFELRVSNDLRRYNRNVCENKDTRCFSWVWSLLVKENQLKLDFWLTYRIENLWNGNFVLSEGFISLESVEASDYIITALCVKYAYKVSPGGVGLCFDMFDEDAQSACCGP